ncbi:caspase family protein [Kitasatospora purpeofusca]|uniref:wHTH domain-containing protein n=1 Tax=Kitasatospora purpeofusca TaxID=67352 RepID=UPI00224D51FC|nr:caspase family protein [Kitasatospora purpeofusca]MCX4689417.1 caspase family protein [Kitasatospora purpeofusca]
MKGSFRALLIGVPKYRDEHITDLPFVRDDLLELEEALSSAGYEVVVHEPDETDREGIDSAVETFFQQAAAGQTLLVYLSGHGIHHDGTDYLVPKGALTSARDFRGKCLALDFAPYVEQSPAGDVAVLVDACREGIVMREMAPSNAVGWSEAKVRRVGRRHYCHVYACSPGERARYATAAGTTFSLFSRALSTVVASETGPSTLADLHEQLQTAVDALTSEHECPRQQVRIRAEGGLDGFVLFERPDREPAGAAGEHPWVALAREHPAWRQVADGPGAEAMRTAVTALVERLAPPAADDDLALAEDPWRPTDLAERMSGRLGWLLSKVLNAEKLALAPAEAALLVAAPFAHAACANRVAVEALPVGPTDLAPSATPSPLRAGYEQFVTGRARLVRRAAQAERGGDTAGAAGIAWWLFRQWLAGRPGGHHENVLTTLCGPVGALTGHLTAAGDRDLVAELFALDALPSLLRSLRTSYDTTAIRPVRQLAGATEAEQYVREELLGALLAVAHQLAVDPLRLPDVVVEHLGISYAVDLAELHGTIQGARWDPRGRTRVLTAACHHPAVGLALRQHAAALDTLLGAIDLHAGADPQLAPLQDLPVHATADQVHAAADERGRPIYESTDLRFRLADDRIQELLMGEQLYGDQALAIRELYQNALDACRYRDARTTYLRRHDPQVPAWSGRIDFHRGVDERGQAYLECRDNGIGMGERELREVFSYAGMRFADLPEFLDEQAAWRAEGIEFHPNSRFGIGVLSYFMMADDISVTTCRLDRDGHPGDRLQVDIAGPGSVFRIRNLGRGHDAGTVVRLHLRNPGTAPSCTGLLGRLLWIAPYDVTAEDAGERLEWAAGVLSPFAPLGLKDPSAHDAVRPGNVQVGATDRADVWWTSSWGGVLADGLWAGVRLFGAVVDLSGLRAPRLTVDRTRPLGYDAAYTSRLLHQQIPTLLCRDDTVLGHEWLSALVEHQPGLADAVLEAAVAHKHQPWSVLGHEADITAVGCFPIDSRLLTVSREWSGWPAPIGLGSGAPELVVAWRTLSWAAAGAVPGVSVPGGSSLPVARPTDDVLLRWRQQGTQDDASWFPETSTWFDPAVPVPLGHVLWAARRLGRRPADVVARMVELGFALREGQPVPEQVDRLDLVVLSRDGDGVFPWLDPMAPVPLGHVLFLARRLDQEPEEVIERLRVLGADWTDHLALPILPAVEDLLLSGQEEPPDWLSPGIPVPLWRILAMAEDAECSPQDVVDLLTALGHTFEDMVIPESVEDRDFVLLSRYADGEAPWLEADEEVSAWHVLTAAHKLDLHPERVVTRLAELGHRVGIGVRNPELLDERDLLVLCGAVDDENEPELTVVGAPVPMGHLLWCAAELDRPPATVASTLERLGHALPDGAVTPERVLSDDLLILSAELNWRTPWLPVDEPVPLGHIVRAANRLGRPLHSIDSTLRGYGYRLPEGFDEPRVLGLADLQMLSKRRDGQAPWLKPGEPAGIWHVLAVAEELGQPPRVVADRLAVLGHPLPPGIVAAHGAEFFAWARSGSGPSSGEPVTLAEVLRAAGDRHAPAETARRLQDLGFTLAGDVVYE